MNSIVIGFTGGTGSGKTTLALRLNEVFKNNSVIIKQDSYYKDFPDKTFEERVQINYDHPDSFDMERFTDDVRRLKAGETIECPVYNYAEYKRDKDTVTVEPKRIIILEGLFLFENPALSDLIDIKVFVDTDADVRILRRIIRDVKERGRSLDSVVLQYLTTVKPMHERFIEPEKKRADIIVPEGGYNEVAFDMIVDAIKHKLN